MQRSLRYDHYKVLGVPRDATTDEVKRAYRERVKQWHPDRNDSIKASEVFHALHEAYLTLKDQGLRTAYDEQLRFYRSAEEAAAPRRPDFNTRARRATVEDGPATRADRTLFHSLHFTGLAFGVLLVSGICIGCGFFGWPTYVLLFTLPGLAVLPDSIAGLRAK